MASLIDKLIKVNAKVFNINRRLYNPYSTLTFLKEDGALVPFAEVAQVTASSSADAPVGWYVDYDRWRQKIVVFVSTGDEDFSENLENSSHVSIDANVYEIEKADLGEPAGAEPYFKIPCRRTGQTYAG